MRHHVAHHRLQEIVDCDDALGLAEFVDHKGEVVALRSECTQEFDQGQRAGNEKRGGKRCFGEIDLAGQCGLQDVMAFDEADGMLKIALADRQTGVW